MEDEWGFGLAQIKTQGHYAPYDVDPEDIKSRILLYRNGKLIFRNYNRELKNGKGMTIVEACRAANKLVDKQQYLQKSPGNN